MREQTAGVDIGGHRQERATSTAISETIQQATSAIEDNSGQQVWARTRARADSRRRHGQERAVGAGEDKTRHIQERTVDTSMNKSRQGVQARVVGEHRLTQTAADIRGRGCVRTASESVGRWKRATGQRQKQERIAGRGTSAQCMQAKHRRERVAKLANATQGMYGQSPELSESLLSNGTCSGSTLFKQLEMT